MAQPTVDSVVSHAAVDVTNALWTQDIAATATMILVSVAWRESTTGADGIYLAAVQCAGVDLGYYGAVAIDGSTIEYWYLESPTTGLAIAMEAIWYDLSTDATPAVGRATARIGSVSLLTSDTTSGIPIQASRTRTARGEQRQIIGGGNVPPLVREAGTSIQGNGVIGANDLFLDTVMITAAHPTVPTVTVDAAQTERWNAYSAGADSFHVRSAGSTRTGSTSKVPMRWTMDTIQNFAQFVLEVKGT